MDDPVQLMQSGHPARDVLVALGRATVDGGCVDLLSCGALATWACPRNAWPDLKGFATIEEEAGCRFTASTHALALTNGMSPLQSEEEWCMESDDGVNIKQAYFLPPDAALQYAQDHPSLIRVAPVWQSYSLGAVLGRGNFAVVKHARRRAARHPVIPREVAIKVIDKARTNDLGAIKNEVALMTRLDHPNIVRLFEIFDAPSRLYLVMELATGGDVFDRIFARGSYSEADAARSVSELCAALAHVHAMGIVHRDLKPENLLCASNADDAPLKVADFGLAKLAEKQRGLGGGEGSVNASPARTNFNPFRKGGTSPHASPHASHASAASAASPACPPACDAAAASARDETPPGLPAALTTPRPPSTAVRRQLSPSGGTPVVSLHRPPSVARRVTWRDETGDVVGTPSYMAPEVLTRSHYSPACDMWAVGVILYFSLRGAPPFFSAQIPVTLERIRKCDYDECEGDGWRDVSAEAKDLIRRLLVLEPRSRLSAKQVLDHPWLRADHAAARKARFRLEDQPDGIARLQSNRQLERSESPLVRLTSGSGKPGSGDFAPRIVEMEIPPLPTMEDAP